MARSSLLKQTKQALEGALQCLEAGEPDDALAAGDALVERLAGLAPAHEIRALALTLLGRIDEADEAFSQAAEIDPEAYFIPFRLDKDAFDAVVEEVLAGLPKVFQEHLENVEIGVDDVPPLDLIAEDLDFDLLGVYIGDTVEVEEGGFPDRVVLYQRNLENISPDRDTLMAEIRDTVLHEIGHHFGMDEDTLREIEDSE